MFAWTRSQAAQTIGPSFGKLAPEARFFWTTMWFNAGAAVAAKYLSSRGIDWWRSRWTQTDDPAQYSRYARYNALWRTATWEAMSRTLTL